MFQLRRLELLHWDYWQRHSLPLDARIITLVGPNGSGKTTLLDALRTLFALRCSGKRDFKRYVRHAGADVAWIRAVVDNPRRAAHRQPFFPILDEEVTLACRICNNGGDWQRQYTLVAGDCSIEELQTRDHWLPLPQYRRQLTSAGMTPAIAEVLALEQGDTDKLCEYTPKALLDLVFQVFGDREVLAAYQDAKVQQIEAERELASLDQQLAVLDSRVTALQRRVDRYRQWQQLQAEHDHYRDQLLPRLRFAEHLCQLQQQAPALLGLRRQLRATGHALAAANAELLELNDRHNHALHHERAQQAELQLQRRHHLQAREAMVEAQAVLRERQRLRDLLQQQHGSALVAAAEQLGSARQRLAEHQQHAHALRLQQAAAETERALWQHGQTPLPDPVARFRAGLTAAGIDHDLLLDIVDIPPSPWHNALQALLAADCWMVVLHRAEDVATAWSLAAQQTYPHPIHPAGVPHPARPDSALAHLQPLRPLPAALSHRLGALRCVDSPSGDPQPWLSRSGFLAEADGGRQLTLGPGNFGTAARHAQAEAADRRSAELATALATLNSEIVGLQRTISDGQRRLEGLDAARELAARAEEFAAAEAVLHAQQAAARIIENRIPAQEQLAVAATAHRHDLELQLQRLDATATQFGHHYNLLLPQYQQQRRQFRHALTERRQLRAPWPAADLQPRDLANLQQQYHSAAAADLHRQSLAAQLAAETWETDPQLPPLRDKMAADHAALAAEVAQRRQENQRAAALTLAARSEYLQVLRHTVRRYGQHLQTLGELAGIAVRVDLPALSNDDLNLAQAGLHVHFNFDDKGHSGLNDGDASGGQQVMKSLILLIALLMEDGLPGGFVFIDEPFAHLDLINIERVGAFLQATRSQYLLTTPNPHTPHVFSPAELTLVSRKKPPGERWAPSLAVIRRQATPADKS